MVRFAWAHACIYLSAVAAQTQSSSSGKADGLTSGAATTTAAVASSGTVTVDGTVRTYSVPFTVPAEADVGEHVLPNIYDPHAPVAQSLCPGYRASNVQNTSTGFNAQLTLAGTPCNVYGTDIRDLSLSVDVQSGHRLSVQIQPTYLDSSNISHYILPSELVAQPTSAGSSKNVDAIDFRFSWTNMPTFAFKITRKSTGDVLFDTTGSVLVYENQFIEFVTQLPEKYNTYGFGERIANFYLGQNFTATFWAADVGDVIDANIYGNHPFYLDTRYYEVSNSTGKRTLITTQNVSAIGHYESYSHGVYQRNSHGMEALLNPTNLTWRALGGSIDLYFFDGPDQAAVTQQYMNVIGMPAMQQYWTHGFHQCRWGYTNWSETEAVVDSYRAFGIPLETIWNDIDWMFQYRDFENDPVRFNYTEGASFLQRLKENGQHYVPIIDSALYIPDPSNSSDAYPIYNDGHARDVWLKNADGSEYIGDVWPGYTVFPDWLSPEAGAWWADTMYDWHQKIPFSGIWLDMSEASSFCVGSCGSGNLSVNPVHPPFLLPGEPGDKIYTYPEGFDKTNASEAKIASSLAASQSSSVAKATPPSTATTPYYSPKRTEGAARNVQYPPYAINNFNGALGVHGLDPKATHSGGVEDYDVHNLFGTQIINATYYAISEKITPGKRPFIIGRSTFAGSGTHGGHWGGDNTSLFAYMYFSISQALNFALFGIPMFGVDTCGFNGNSDEELCNRWMQLSAFFPFYRNHNTLSANSQEAYVWESVIVAAKKAMSIRYSLLPYMYTLFYGAHTSGSTVMRALSWEFPDPTLKAIDNQFLLGPALMVVPALGQGMTEVKGVFPGVAQGQLWYDWYSQEKVSVRPGENKTIPAPLGHIPVFVRGGYILPQQEALLTTKESRNSPWSLICALDARGSANGQLYVDDGESIDPDSTLLIDLAASNGTLFAKTSGSYRDTHPLANVTLLGVNSQPNRVSLNGRTITSGVTYNQTSKVLSLRGLQNETSSGAWTQDWRLTWL